MWLKFDLKGSLVNRLAIPPTTKREWKLLAKVTVLKDQDLRDLLHIQPDIINLKLDDRMKIVRTLANDSTFLMKHGLMDYSLLLAIEKVDLVEENEQRKSGLSYLISEFDRIDKTSN